MVHTIQFSLKVVDVRQWLPELGPIAALQMSSAEANERITR
jgi:hypothetical protein